MTHEDYVSFEQAYEQALSDAIDKAIEIIKHI